MTGEWRAVGAAQFVDRRSRLTRLHGLVRQNVRAWRGRIVFVEPGVQPFEAKCGHAHQKASVAKRCAETEAAARNRRGVKP